jgi:uncharacterized protein with von Willebrand factor type A (vWA) domain
MLPHVDLFLPVHNLKTLVDLARTLNGEGARRRLTPKEKHAWK